jgi:flagellar biosynthesis protein FlhG
MHKEITKKAEFPTPFIFSVLSGKGGVGKSMTSVNLAEVLGSSGYRVALLDADIGLSNCAMLLNENVNASVANWVNGECMLEDLPHTTDHLTLVTGCDSPSQTYDIETLMDAMDQVILHLSHDHDIIIIDTPAGAGEISLWALDRSEVGALVLIDEPTSISDAYRLCKYIYSIDPDYPFATIVNQAENGSTAEDTYQRFNSILKYFLNKELPNLGFIPYSEKVKNSVSNQSTLLQNKETNEQVLNELVYITQHLIGLAKSVSNQLQTAIE